MNLVLAPFGGSGGGGDGHVDVPGQLNLVAINPMAASSFLSLKLIVFTPNETSRPAC